MSKYTYDYVTQMQEHLLALEHTRVSMDDSEPIPWDLVTAIETGGQYRLGISTSQRVVAKHPSGIQMIWFVDLEPSSANGTSRLQLDTELIADLLEKAPAHASAELHKWLVEAKAEVDKQIKETESWLYRMRETSALFGKVAKETP